jgi:hypothetical protein
MQWRQGHYDCCAGRQPRVRHLNNVSGARQVCSSYWDCSTLKFCCGNTYGPPVWSPCNAITPGKQQFTQDIRSLWGHPRRQARLLTEPHRIAASLAYAVTSISPYASKSTPAKPNGIFVSHAQTGLPTCRAPLCGWSKPVASHDIRHRCFFLFVSQYNPN